ncbi:GDSL esterase/lipase 1-like protein [Tanacetum coccineum]|uniref:GDSL esterase/lipase 1-like protein n=1 Tax=Tanacetum coccineum TaxID=301880 RepID=A0ABQ5IMI7_9ASTR
MAVASRKLGALVLVAVLCLSLPTGCLSSQQAAALFVFGDSCFDPAEYASLPFIPAYLEPNNDFTHGANFASAGAGALIDSHAGFAVGLQTQLRYFGDLVNHYRQNLGDIKSRQLLSDAVYLLSCGGNDYQSPYYPYTQEQYVDIVIGNMTNFIKGIYEKGGRKFGIVTVPHMNETFPWGRMKNPIVPGDLDDEESTSGFVFMMGFRSNKDHGQLPKREHIAAALCAYVSAFGLEEF